MNALCPTTNALHKGTEEGTYVLTSLIAVVMSMRSSRSAFLIRDCVYLMTSWGGVGASSRGESCWDDEDDAAGRWFVCCAILRRATLGIPVRGMGAPWTREQKTSLECHSDAHESPSLCLAVFGGPTYLMRCSL